MTLEEAVAWCAEHEVTVEFRYRAHTLAGVGLEPTVTARTPDRGLRLIPAADFSVNMKVYAATLVEAVEKLAAMLLAAEEG